jgi:hypothetical protein
MGTAVVETSQLHQQPYFWVIVGVIACLQQLILLSGDKQQYRHTLACKKQ